MNKHTRPTAPGAAKPLFARQALRGISLVELLVTLAIAAVLMMVAVPSLASVMHSVQLSSTTNTLLASLRLARSEAIRRGGRITICKSAEGTACTKHGGWEQGWIVFQDLNGNESLETAEPLIQHYENLQAGYRLTGNTPVSRGFTFTSQGTIRSLSGGMLAGSLTLCRQSLQPGDARRIVLSSGGRPRLQKLQLDQCG